MEEIQLDIKKVKFNNLLIKGKVSSDGKIWLNKKLAIEFQAKLQTAIMLKNKTMLWKDTNREVIELTIEEALIYLKEANDTLDTVFFGRTVS